MEIESPHSVPAKGCFVWEDKVWFPLNEMRRYSGMNQPLKFGQPEMAQSFSAMDLERVMYKTDLDSEKIRWGIPIAQLDFPIIRNTDD
jgi:hypothetical protein